MKNDPQTSRSLEFLKGGGELGQVMRDTDWSATPLGPIADWSQPLLTAVSVMLAAPQPSYIFWGPELSILYNDRGLPFVGMKHPACLGHGIRVVLKEAWPVLGPLVEGVVATGAPVYLENLLIPLERVGFLQDGYFTFSYIPIRNEVAEVGGILVLVNETTERVLGERRLALIRELSLRAAVCQTVSRVLQSVEEVLARAESDVPFALLYELRGQQAQLVLSAGLAQGLGAAPIEIELREPGGWPLAAVRDAGEQLVDDLATRFGALPGGTSGDPAQRAFLLPLAGEGEEPSHILVAGLNPRYLFDADARSFLQLLARQIATSITSTRALQEKTQRAAQLAELDRQKIEFFSNVSHEFRTPLTLMLGPIEDGLADARQPLPPAQRERLELVRRNGLRLQKLVNTLLDFSRVEAGRAHASFVPSDLSSFTREVASSFESAMRSAGIRLVVDCPPLPAPINVDPTMWEKIVLNLLSNALKFTFEGEVTVSLGWRGESVELSVRDTGTGIPEDELPRIFDRFHRVQGARGRSHEGSGIGLALVKDLVTLHGGNVRVTSALGRGTTFTVRVPTGSAHLPPPSVQAAARALVSTGIGPDSFLAEIAQWKSDPPAPVAFIAPTAQGPSPPAPAARVLVVDDNADMRNYLASLLSPHWEVDAVSDGSHAVLLARANPPDLVVSDVMMPGVSGLELVSILRVDERTRTIPVILLSARAGEKATIEGLDHGANDYLVKPFSANELIARVNAQLTAARLRKSALQTERSHAEEAQRLLATSQLATRSREEMLAIVSHDLRSPLGAITMSAALLERAFGDGSQAQAGKYLETIHRSARRMGRLISDLLDLGSIDTGSLSIQRGPQRVEDIVGELQQMFEPQALEKGLELMAHVEASLPSLNADKERLIQALGNLVSNSLKFTREGSVSIRAQSHPGGIVFSVSDTGSGVAPEALSRIFDRYWHSAQGGREGHGLGLAITKGIVEAHGGSLRAESVLGQGTIVTVVLPTEPMAASADAASRLAPASSGPASNADFLAGGGEMGQLIRAMDWSKTPLGAVESWPQSLRTTVSLCMASSFPISLAWGPKHTQIYNDGYWPICGGKHPHSMGQDFSECWASAWPAIGEAFERALAGETQFLEDQRMFLDRNGYLEETFFTFSFSPIRDETGGIGGLFHPVTETTGKMLSERRTRSLRELAARTSKAKALDEAFALAAHAIAEGELDIPFMLFYAVDSAGEEARLAASTGLPVPSAAAPASIDLSAVASSWPIAEVVRSGAVHELDDVAARLASTACGAYPEPPERALLMPITLPGATHPAAVIVAGVSPRLPLDDVYRAFFDLAASTITAALANARAYEQERKRAEALAEVDRAKTTFFSNVSHEFRTPLTLILGPVEDALSSPKRSLEGDSLDVVRRNALRLYKMVNTLLDFSRMEAGRAQATFVPTDLAAFTANLASHFHSAVQSAGLELHVDCPPLPEAIYVDPEMWEKVVLNLLSNAVKYTYEGEIRVSLACEGEHVLLSVADTGVGIPEDELQHVFERFYRVSVTQGRSHEGNGIGLSLVQELVKLHGGSLHAASKLGQGSRFTVTLPRGHAHLPQERLERTQRPRSAGFNAALFTEEAHRWSLPEVTNEPRSVNPALAREPEVMPAALASARILVADDNADLRGYVTGLLGRLFRDVRTVPDGQAALEAARSEPPDLILSDVMMPRLDGFSLVRELRADERTRAIPIILLSARAGDGSTVEGLQSGADDYLVKPFSARELIARVHTHLEMARIRREVVRHELMQEQLLSKLRARDEWLTVVSHELRTPLTALSLSVFSLIGKSAANAPETTRPGAIVERQLDRLKRQVEELVDVAGLLSGSLQLTLEDLDAGEVVAAAIEERRSRAPGRELPIVLNISGPVPCRGDRARLRQLVAHLLDNALKFGAGKPVEVSVTRVQAQASIAVQDHGSGVEREDQERIFGRFERAAEITNHGGFGLGLWVVRLIAEAHGGSVRVTSTEGGGATFITELPTHG
jgi:signal transduction histidine kinase